MRSHSMTQLTVTAIVLVASSCNGTALDRSTAATIILASRPWGSQQSVLITREQFSCGVTAGLWTYERGTSNEYPSWRPTATGAKLGLPRAGDNGLPARAVSLQPGFSATVNVTGVAVDASGPSRSHVEAMVSANIPHGCFPTGLPFYVDGRGNVPMTFTFARFDDGWRVVQ